MNIPYTHESIRLTGRWDTREEYAAHTTTTGAYIEFCFSGNMAVARFDVTANAMPRLHLWIQLDGGVLTEAPIDSRLRILAPTDGVHTCRIIYKGGSEQARRWYAPLTGKVSFIGVQTDCPVAIAPDTRRTVEFVGDSITEGVLIDVDFDDTADCISHLGEAMRCYQDDVCATYAWRTAEALDLRPVFMGYGAVGVTKAGCGGVPAAQRSYPFNFDKSPITHAPCDIIVINHGANDRHRPEAQYLAGYAELLDVVRARNPHSVIVSLSAFCGGHHEALGRMIDEYNRQNNCHVHFIDSFGWIPVDPLHPLRDGHATVAEHLVPLLDAIIKENFR